VIPQCTTCIQLGNSIFFHSASVCFEWLSQLTTIIPLNRNKWLAFIIEMDCLLYETGAVILNSNNFNPPIYCSALTFLANSHSFPNSDWLSFFAYSLFQHGTKNPFPHYNTPAAANHTIDNLGCLHCYNSRPVWPSTGKKIQHHRTKHQPRPTAPHRTCTDSARTLHCNSKTR